MAVEPTWPRSSRHGNGRTDKATVLDDKQRRYDDDLVIVAVLLFWAHGLFAAGLWYLVCAGDAHTSRTNARCTDDVGLIMIRLTLGPLNAGDRRGDAGDDQHDADDGCNDDSPRALALPIRGK